jgi:hypothetical protein
MMKKYLLALTFCFLASQAWAQKTIDQLGAGTTLTGTEQLPMFQGSNPAVTTTPSAIKTYVGGGSAIGTVTSIATGCQATGGTITTTGTIATQELQNLQTGSNYAIVTGDCGHLDQLSNSGAQTPTIAEAGSAGFPSGWYVDVCNINTGAQTLTPGAGTVGGASTLVIAAGTAAAPKCYRLISDGVSNYDIVFPPGGGGGTPGGSNTQVQYNNSSAFGGISGVTSDGTAMTFANGDLKLSGSGSGTSLLEAPATGGGTATFFAGSDTVAGLGTVQTWAAAQTFTNGDFLLQGSSSGAMTLEAPAAASTYIQTFHAETGTVVNADSTDTFTNKTITSSTNSLGGVTAAFGSDAKGDLYTNGGSSNVITRLAIGSTNNCLIVTSGLPAWAACPAGTITAGSTATASFTSGDLIGTASSLATDSGVAYKTAGLSLPASAGSATTPNLSLLECGADGVGTGCGFYSPASGKFGVSVAGAVVWDYAITTSARTTISSILVTTGSIINGGTTFQCSANCSFTTTGIGNNTILSSSSTTNSASVGLVQLTAGTATGSASGSAGTIDITAGASTSSNAASNGGSVVITAGTSTNGTAGTIQMVNLGTAATGTAYLCWNSSGNVVSEDTTCTVSAQYAKNLQTAVTPQQADVALDKLRIGAPVWDYKAQYGTGTHVGLIADDVERMDPRCAIYEKGKLKSYEDRCIIAYLVADRQEMKREIADLKLRMPQ